MRFISIALPALLLIPIAVYLHRYFLRMAETLLPDAGERERRLIALLPAILAGLTAFDVWGIGVIIVLHLFCFALLGDLIRALAVRLRRNRRRPRPEMPETLWRSGLIPALCTALVLICGFVNFGRIVETRYTVTTDKPLPAGGCRVAMVSDLHAGTGDLGALERAAARIAAAKPDLLVLCGDLVDERTTAAEMRRAVAALGAVNAPLGTYFVYGNHDVGQYYDGLKFTAAQFEEALGAAGIRILADGTARPAPWLTLVGRRDASDRSRLSAAALTAGAEGFVLMLDHQPGDFAADRAAGVDLLLSGHTHAGQIWPGGLFIDLFGRDTYSYGLRRFGPLTAIVSSGIAGWGYPVRTEKHSEYVLIDLRNPA